MYPGTWATVPTAALEALLEVAEDPALDVADATLLLRLLASEAPLAESELNAELKAVLEAPPLAAMDEASESAEKAWLLAEARMEEPSGPRAEA